MKIISPIRNQLKLDLKFNLKNRHFYLKTLPITEDIGALQKAADYVKAIALGEFVPVFS